MTRVAPLRLAIIYSPQEKNSLLFFLIISEVVVYSISYRVMFEQRASTYGAKRKYVRISRYETQSTDKFLVSNDGTQWNIHQFDWSIPAETMDIPLAGFLYEDGMSDFGSGTILRAAEGDDTKSGHNWTMYLRSGHRGIAVAAGSRRMLGENIRCVRDVNAK
jgi:hypothetical protein